MNVNSTVSNLVARRMRMVKLTTRPLYLWDRAPVPTLQRAGWAHGTVWMGVEKRKSLVHTGTRTLDRPGCSKSLYRVRKPGHFREGRKLIWIKDHNISTRDKQRTRRSLKVPSFLQEEQNAEHMFA